jgi:hypothetical protein
MTLPLDTLHLRRRFVSKGPCGHSGAVSIFDAQGAPWGAFKWKGRGFSKFSGSGEAVFLDQIVEYRQVVNVCTWFQNSVELGSARLKKWKYLPLWPTDSIEVLKNDKSVGLFIMDRRFKTVAEDHYATLTFLNKELRVLTYGASTQSPLMEDSKSLLAFFELTQVDQLFIFAFILWVNTLDPVADSI